MTSRHPVLIERRGVFRTSFVWLLWQSEIYMITKRKNMLICLHLIVSHYDFNIKIYCIRFISFKSPFFLTHVHFWLTGQTDLWRSEHASFFRSIQDGVTSLTVLFPQLDVIIEGVLWAIGGKWECSSWSFSCIEDLLKVRHYLLDVAMANKDKRTAIIKKNLRRRWSCECQRWLRRKLQLMYLTCRQTTGNSVIISLTKAKD